MTKFTAAALAAVLVAVIVPFGKAEFKCPANNIAIVTNHVNVSGARGLLSHLK